MGACNTKDGISEPKTKKESAFQSCDELKDFDTFFPAGTTSSLCKNMSKEIWEEYKDMSDDSGVSFKVCVFSGIKNLDSGIGVYAGSHSSYTKFSKLFDKVILDYHGHKPEDTHQSDMTSEGLTGADLDEDDAAMIISTRIRVGRNLEEFPLGPGVTKEQRLEIMEKVTEAAKTFDDDLQGTFYPLEGMEIATQEQLIADHFLFK